MQRLQLRGVAPFLFLYCTIMMVLCIALWKAGSAPHIVLTTPEYSYRYNAKGAGLLL